MRFACFYAIALAIVCFGFDSCSVPGATFEAPASVAVNVSAIASGLVGAGAPIEPGTNPQVFASVCCDPVACAATSPCPTPLTAGGYTMSFECISNVCDPFPVDVTSTPTSIDVAALSSDELSAISDVEVRSITFTITKNTLTSELEPIAIYWGSSGATSYNSPGATLLGDIPAIEPGVTGAGHVELDAGGLSALNDYLTTKSKQVKLFYRTRVDLAPGQPIPGGEVAIDALVSVRVSGSTH